MSLEVKTIGQTLNDIFDVKKADNESIVNQYFNQSVSELRKCATVGKSIYHLNEELYPELYSDDSTIYNLFEELLLSHDLFLYFDTNKYQYVITFVFKKVKYLIEKGL